MMQLIQKLNAPQINYINLNLYDVHNGAPTMDQGFRPLISIKSQQTGSVKNFMPVSIVLTNKERYVEMLIINSNYDSLSLGVIEIGNDDFPYGFYDTIIYANSSDSNLDPALASAKIFTGLMNVSAENNDAVSYTSYEENDSDTTSVYITNNIT